MQRVNRLMILFCAMMRQCSLGESVKDGRTVLKVKTGGKNCVLASLMANKIESSVLELMFEEVGTVGVRAFMRCGAVPRAKGAG
jgi:hypothetical protein